ncbi:MAG TPA: hypothetical protein VM841_05895 [Actinomycetota bacterium]|nr:hypothetical protein [Actinomycetota bacterium]
MADALAGLAENEEDAEARLEAALADAVRTAAALRYDAYDLAPDVLHVDRMTARRLRDLRQLAGPDETVLTQESLAEHMNALGFKWSRVTVVDIERDARRLSVAELFGLALLFRVGIGELVAPGRDQRLLVADEVGPLDARAVAELVSGRGGARWAVAARVLPEGVEGPAKELWARRRAAEGDK